jgi:hypothetical protein
MRVCARCSNTIDLEGKIARSSTCPNCGAYLHSCVNCKFYSPGRHNDCSEPQAELVSGKRGANFCDFFVMQDAAGGAPSSWRDKKNKAHDDFGKLFGG